MNTNPGVYGTKLGCTQIFNADGTVTRVTVVEAPVATIVSKRSSEEHGYTALQLAFGEKRAALVNKPMKGFFDKSGVSASKTTRKGKETEVLPRTIRELRLAPADAARFEVGQTVSIADMLKEGQFVDVSGTSKGRGFSGVFRRHNFAGFVRTHGTHEYRRHGGSIGTNMTPGRTLPGLRMPGQHGNKRSTTLNLKIAKIVPEQNLVLIEGSVPGSRNALVCVRGAIKNGKHA